MDKFSLEIAFYKGNDWLDKLIKLWTRGPYSHVELIMNDMWITSHPSVGIRSRKAPTDLENWDIITIEYDSCDMLQDTFVKYYNDQIGCKYDWKGIFFSQFFKIGYNQDDKWFCSEFVTKLLQVLSIYEVLDLQPNKIDPSELYRVLEGRFNANS